MSKRKSGLGVNAFFTTPAAANLETDEDESRPAPVSEPPRQIVPDKPAKVRTTVTLYPDTLATLEDLKVQARRRGNKSTFSDILDEAIQDLARKWGIKS